MSEMLDCKGIRRGRVFVVARVRLTLWLWHGVCFVRTRQFLLDSAHSAFFILFYFILFKQEYKTSEDILQLTSVFKFHFIYSNIGEILKMNIFGSLASNLNTRSNKYDQ